MAFALPHILVGQAVISRPFRLTPYLQALEIAARSNYRTLLNEIIESQWAVMDMRLSRNESTKLRQRSVQLFLNRNYR